MNIREVIIRTSAGRFHRASVADGREAGERGLFRSSIQTFEGCNVDDVVGVLREVPSLPPDVSVSALCGRCFPLPERVEA